MSWKNSNSPSMTCLICNLCWKVTPAMASDDTETREGWSNTTLGALGRYLNGRAFKTAEWSTMGRPIIRIQDLTGSNSNPHYFEGDVEERYVVRPGDLLISWSATLGAFVWDGPEAVLNQHIFKVESDIDQRFHYHLVRERIAELERQAHGSGMVHVTKGTFEQMPVAVPVDLAEQRRLADLIDDVEVSQRSALAHLRTATNLLEQLRLAILMAACSGRLSDEWRRLHENDVVGDDSLIELAGQRRRLALGSKFRVPVLNEHTHLPDLPSTWTVAPLGLLLESIKYGTSQKSIREGVGVPVLRIPNVSGGSVELTDLKYSPLSERESEDLALERRDLLMIRSNGSPNLVGKSVLVGKAAEGMAFAGYLMRLRTDPKICDASFLALAMASPDVRQQIEMPLRSTSGINNINTAEVRNLAIPLPPLGEQIEVAKRASDLLARTDRALSQVLGHVRDVELSSQALLTKAFAGGLDK